MAAIMRYLVVLKSCLVQERNGHIYRRSINSLYKRVEIFKTQLIDLTSFPKLKRLLL